MARISSKHFLNYLAGFVDGEGTVGVNRRSRSKGRWYSYDPYLTITNSSIEVLEMIKATIGFGSIRGRKKSNGTYTKRPVYSYWLSNHKARTVLKSIYPYLVVKKSQAKLVINLPKRGDTYNYKKQEEIYNKLKILHGRRNSNG